MKKLYSYCMLTVSILCGMVLHAQTTPYHKLLAPNTTDWYIFEDFILTKPAAVTNTVSFHLERGKYSAYTDTTVLGQDYKKMYHVYTYPGLNMPEHLGYIREDTIARKVYFLDAEGTAEDLLYDFSLSPGATVQLDFTAGFYPFPGGSYTVTTVDSVLTRVGYRKQLKLLSTGSDTLIYIESIGSIMHPLYLYGLFAGGPHFMQGSGGCSYPYNLGVSCKFSDNEKYYQSCTYTLAQNYPCIYKYDSCNYYSGCSKVSEIQSCVDHILVPNPATDKTTLELLMNKELAATIELYDIFGRKLKEVFTGQLQNGKNEINIDLADYQNGYYFLKVQGKELNLNSSLIIAR